MIGSGPAGLSASYHLARLGYRVTLFEAGKELGGVLRTGIPSYRLPREVLDREISFILRHGVEAQDGTADQSPDPARHDARVRRDLCRDRLAGIPRLNLGQLSSDIVTQGIDFLDRARRGEEFLTGQRVAVIGGGNTAMDAARSARRIGAGACKFSTAARGTRCRRSRRRLRRRWKRGSSCTSWWRRCDCTRTRLGQCSRASACGWANRTRRGGARRCRSRARMPSSRCGATG